jgi:tRNA(fMet)-specific endonuclease VapC
VKYVLDTDICIWVLRRIEPLRSRVAGSSPADLAVTSITEAELLYGALNSSDPVGNSARVTTFLSGLAGRLPFESEAAQRHTQIRFALRSLLIGERDLIIASTALAHGSVLVTHNVREFSRVPGLSVEDWRSP